MPEETYLRQYNNNGDLIRDFSGKNSADVFYTGDSIYILRDDFKMFHYGEPGWIPHSTDNPDGSVGIDVVKTCQAGETIYFLQKDKNVLHFGHNGRERGLGNNDIANIYQTGDSVYVLTDARKLTHYGENGWIRHPESEDSEGWIGTEVTEVICVGDTIYFTNEQGDLFHFEHDGYVRLSDSPEDYVGPIMVDVTLSAPVGSAAYIANEVGELFLCKEMSDPQKVADYVDHMQSSGDILYAINTPYGEGHLTQFDQDGYKNNLENMIGTTDVVKAGDLIYALRNDGALFRYDDVGYVDHVRDGVIDIARTGSLVYVQTNDGAGMLSQFDESGFCNNLETMIGTVKIAECGDLIYALKNDGNLYRYDEGGYVDHVRGSVSNIAKTGDLVYVHTKGPNELLAQYDESGYKNNLENMIGTTRIAECGNLIYAVDPDGNLFRYGEHGLIDLERNDVIDIARAGNMVYVLNKNNGFNHLTQYDENGPVNDDHQLVGTKQVIQLGNLVYVLKNDGNLFRYDETGYIEHERGLVTQIEKIGNFLYVLSSDQGGMLMQYNEDGYVNNFENMFGTVRIAKADYILYALKNDGNLFRFNHIGYVDHVRGSVADIAETGSLVYVLTSEYGGQLMQFGAAGYRNNLEGMIGTIQIVKIGDLIYALRFDGNLYRYDESGYVDHVRGDVTNIAAVEDYVEVVVTSDEGTFVAKYKATGLDAIIGFTNLGLPDLSYSGSNNAISLANQWIGQPVLDNESNTIGFKFSDKYLNEVVKQSLSVSTFYEKVYGITLRRGYKIGYAELISILTSDNEATIRIALKMRQFEIRSNPNYPNSRYKYLKFWTGSTTTVYATVTLNVTPDRQIKAYTTDLYCADYKLSYSANRFTPLGRQLKSLLEVQLNSRIESTQESAVNRSALGQFGFIGGGKMETAFANINAEMEQSTGFAQVSEEMFQDIIHMGYLAATDSTGVKLSKTKSDASGVTILFSYPERMD